MIVPNHYIAECGIWNCWSLLLKPVPLSNHWPSEHCSNYERTGEGYGDGREYHRSYGKGDGDGYGDGDGALTGNGHGDGRTG